MVWCFSTRASVATVLTTHPCVSRCLRVKQLKPKEAYMRQWTRPSLVQIMSCRLFGAKALSKPSRAYCQLESREHISMKYFVKFKSFQENAFENVICEKAGILSRFQCVNWFSSCKLSLNSHSLKIQTRNFRLLAWTKKNHVAFFFKTLWVIDISNFI